MPGRDASVALHTNLVPGAKPCYLRGMRHGSYMRQMVLSLGLRVESDVTCSRSFAQAPSCST
jgi:hypothetical protein